MLSIIRKKLVSCIPYKKEIKQLVRKVKQPPQKVETEFSERIDERLKAFWRNSEAKSIVDNLNAPDITLDCFKDAEHWQRKLSNKYNSRIFANLHNCQIPDLYWKGRDVNSLDFSQLPNSFVIRPAKGHSCKSVFLMHKGINLMDRKAYSEKEIKALLQELIDRDPQLLILVEEFVKTEKGETRIPDDYKFYTFNGEIACVQVINRYGAHDGVTTWYDENWNRLENINGIYKIGEPQQQPGCFHEMREQARTLSKSYELFVRIDFYATDKGPIFGEFTPTPGKGKSFTKYGSDLFISYWDKYCSNMV